MEDVMTTQEKPPTPEEITLSKGVEEEDRKIRHLRRMVDFTSILIMQSDMDLEEAQRHTTALRDFALRLFPGKEHVFDMVYGPRLKRLLVEKYNLS
jgi:hypothetical protein